MASTNTSPPSTTLLLICSSCPACRLPGDYTAALLCANSAKIAEVGCFAAESSLLTDAHGITLRSMEGLQRRLAVARGDEPADLVVRGGRVLSVFTREWLEADVAVVDGVIAGVGSYEGRESLDASGSFVVPGFIDAHMHLESVKLMVDEFARLVLPLGTTAVVADPHEIANVLGVDGVHWLLDATLGPAARRLLHGAVVRSRRRRSSRRGAR